MNTMDTMKQFTHNDLLKIYRVASFAGVEYYHTEKECWEHCSSAEEDCYVQKWNGSEWDTIGAELNSRINRPNWDDVKKTQFYGL